METRSARHGSRIILRAAFLPEVGPDFAFPDLERGLGYAGNLLRAFAAAAGQPMTSRIMSPFDPASRLGRVAWVTWTTSDGGTVRVYTKEPETTWSKRFTADVLGILPIHSML